MRVALFIRRFSTRGGNERQAVEFARHLVKRGHRAEVYCHKADDSADGIVDPSDVHLLRGVRFDPTAAMLSYAWAARRVVHRLRESNEVKTIGFGPSVVQDVYRLGGGTHAEFLRLTKDHPEARGGPVLDRMALRMERARLRPHNTPWLVAPSERVQSELIEHYGVSPDRIEVIWNGTNLERFSPADADRTSMPIAADETVALFVGQDPYRKGFDVAVDATRRVGMTLMYVGRARRPDDLPDHVRWVGERQDVERYYRAADVLLAPSRYDPFGGVVLEAAACGLPSVATRRIGATERFSGGPLDALLVDDPEDVAAIAERLVLATSSQRRSELRAEARRAVQTATLETWGDRMIDVLGRVR